MNLERRRLFKVTLVLHIDLRILLKVKTAVCQLQAEGLCNLRTTEDTNIDRGGGLKRRFHACDWINQAISSFALGHVIEKEETASVSAATETPAKEDCLQICIGETTDLIDRNPCSCPRGEQRGQLQKVKVSVRCGTTDNLWKHHFEV